MPKRIRKELKSNTQQKYSKQMETAAQATVGGSQPSSARQPARQPTTQPY